MLGHMSVQNQTLCTVAYFDSVCQIKMEFVYWSTLTNSAQKMSDVQLLFHALHENLDLQPKGLCTTI